MFVLLDKTRVDLCLGEKITVREAIKLLELTLCRELRRPLGVTVNHKTVTEKTWDLIRVGDLDIFEVSEQVSNVGMEAITSNAQTKQNLSRTASMRKGLLREETVKEFRDMIRNRGGKPQ